MTIYYSPLRYPGGKSKLYNYTVALLENNHLIGCTYCEPFAGGAGLALKLLLKGHVSQLLLNDLDRSIFAFWATILNDTDAFCEAIADIPVTMNEWYKQKEVQNNKSAANLFDLALSTFFLNRTNVSGIIMGGVIGGYKQTGKYKMNCRFNKPDLIKRIKRISEFKDVISIFNKDAIDFIHNEVNNLDNKNTFVFIDPPYYAKGPTLYLNAFEHSDHQDLANTVQATIKCPYIITYDNHEVIHFMYKELDPEEFSIYYSANKKGNAKEIRMLSQNLAPV